jgi:hypothetical protein
MASARQLWPFLHHPNTAKSRLISCAALLLAAISRFNSPSHSGRNQTVNLMFHGIANVTISRWIICLIETMHVADTIWEPFWDMLWMNTGYVSCSILRKREQHWTYAHIEKYPWTCDLWQFQQRNRMTGQIKTLVVILNIQVDLSESSKPGDLD